MINDALRQIGGSVVPMDALHSVCHPNPPVGSKQGCPPVGEGRAVFPLDTSISYIFNSKKLHLLAFPFVGGVLQWGQGKLHVSSVCIILSWSNHMDPFVMYLFLLIFVQMKMHWPVMSPWSQCLTDSLNFLHQWWSHWERCYLTGTHTLWNKLSQSVGCYRL